MEYVEFTGKTVDDAITEACQKFTITSDRLDYEVIEKGTAGIFGFAAKPAVIKARILDPDAPKKEAASDDTSKVNEDKANEVKEEKASTENTEELKSQPAADPKEFLSKIFEAMKMEVDISVETKDNEMDIELSGKDMGVLIGKRGQTLDSLQYLTSIVVNKGQKEYIRVKVDTENYRSRRKETLENLAKNLAYKAKRTKNQVSLEPMNPYERRIIHSALQNDKYVTTHSEGEEPFRKVIITPVK